MDKRPSAFTTPSRLRDRKRKVRKRLALLFLALLILIAGGVVALSYLPHLRITNVSVSHTKGTDPEAIKALVFRELSGRSLFVFPKNNAFVYSDVSLAHAITTAFPKIAKVQTTLVNFSSLEVKVLEREPQGLWCGASKAEVMTPCFFLDARGFIYEPAPEFSGNAYRRWYGALHTASAVGSQYMSPDEFESLSALMVQFEKEGIPPIEVALDESGDIRVSCEGDFTLLFSRTQKPEEILIRLHTAEESSPLAGKTLTDLSYLDLRFGGNRLYYKFK